MSFKVDCTQVFKPFSILDGAIQGASNMSVDEVYGVLMLGIQLLSFLALLLIFLYIAYERSSST